jgi:peptidoglycan/LPS O-acetylase OafA/YrhL
MATPQGIKAQLIYIQWLRVFLIVMVVAHHGAQPYGPTGGRWPVEDPTNLPWLLYVFATNAAFGMGFFFLISGYFVDRS